MNLVARLIAPAVGQLSMPADANHVLRVGIAVVAAGIAFAAVIASRLRAAKVDQENAVHAEVGARA